MAKERIGILGGTFDPIHQGHIRMAQAALDQCHLDKVLVIPAGENAYKPCIASSEDRWKMVVSACTQDVRLIPSRLELDRPAPAYTVDTLLALHRQYPKAEFFFILGTDGMLKLSNWTRLSEVLPLCSFLVCPRTTPVPPDAFALCKKELTALGAHLFMIPMEPITVSSTDIRNALSRGLPTPNLFPPLREFCAAKGLYGVPARIAQAGNWIDGLFAALNPRRFAHSLSVALVSRRLARLHGCDLLQAEQAGLLHDCAKCLPVREMAKIATRNAITDDPALLSSGALLHSLVGAWIAEHDYGVSDPAVLEAIAYHNTGHPGMSRLAMCVCLADYIEPLRGSHPLLENVRVLSELSLEKALLMSLEGTAEYVQSRGKYLHPRTQETIAWLKTLPAIRTVSPAGAPPLSSGDIQPD